MSTTNGGVPNDISPIVSLDNTYGALFICLLISAVLFGFTNLQVVLYIQTQWRRDRTMYKFTVIWLWLLDALHLVLVFHLLYKYFITDFGNLSLLRDIIWSFKAQIAVDVIVVFSVHALYAHRLWLLGKLQGTSRIFSAVQITITMVGSGVAILMCYMVFKCQVYTDLQNVMWATISVLAVIASNDFIIAACMSYLVVSTRTGFSNTNDAMKKIIIYLCSTGCLTSFCSLAAIITCATMPTNFVFLAIEFLLTKLYVNSFIALLNSRTAKESFGDHTPGSSASTMRRPPRLAELINRHNNEEGVIKSEITGGIASSCYSTSLDIPLSPNH